MGYRNINNNFRALEVTRSIMALILIFISNNKSFIELRLKGIINEGRITWVTLQFGTFYSDDTYFKHISVYKYFTFIVTMNVPPTIITLTTFKS